MTFQDQLAQDVSRVEELLDSQMTDIDDLGRAMRYAALQGGKRLRAHLVYEGARLNDVDQKRADAAAMAIELVHAYSLVHDDLPAMDDDDLRRGKPTVHKAWSEWLAILVGDNLQSKAIEILAEAAPDQVASFARAAGDMVQGQFLDLDAETSGRLIDAVGLEKLQSLKTGALIEWSATFGARAGGNDPTPYMSYAKNLGLAYQIWDDVLDIEASSAELGKTAGKDERAGKATMVSYYGIEGAKTRARAAIDSAKAAIAGINNADGLRQLADFVITRRN